MGVFKLASNFGGKSRKLGGMEEQHMIGQLISQLSANLVERRKGRTTQAQLLLGNHEFRVLLRSSLLG